MAHLAVRRLAKAFRLVFGRLRWAGWRLFIGPGSLPYSTQIAAGVRFSVTDGGVLRLGARTLIDRNATIIVQGGTLEIGPDSYIGVGAVIVARESVRIGRHALIGEYVTVRDQDHDFGPGRTTAEAGFRTAPVAIGDNVWLGAKTTVTRGVTIGDNAVVGANSVVTRDAPADCAVAGAPARVVSRVGEKSG